MTRKKYIIRASYELHEIGCAFLLLFQKHTFLLRRKEIYKQSSCVSRTYTTIPNEFLIREIHPGSNPRQFFLIRLTFCKANIVDTNRYSLENVLLSFFRPFSSVGPSSRFFSFLLSLSLYLALFPPRPIDFVPYVANPPPYDRFCQHRYERDVEKFCSPAAVSSISISLPLRAALPFASLFVFSRADWTLRARIPRKFPARPRGRKVKAKWKSASLFLKIVREIHRVFAGASFPLFLNRCGGQLSNPRLKRNIAGICLQRTPRETRANERICDRKCVAEISTCEICRRLSLKTRECEMYPVEVPES